MGPDSKNKTADEVWKLSLRNKDPHEKPIGPHDAMK